MSRLQKGDTRTSGFIQESSLNKLRCSQCKKYLSKFPIRRSSNGDVICGRCPLSADNDFFRDELYENAVEFHIFPCVNRSAGCLKRLLPAETGTHEERCMYRTYKCPISVPNACLWKGSLNALLGHFNDKHPALVLKDGSFQIVFVDSDCQHYLIPDGDDFYVVTTESNTENKIAILIEYAGFRKDSDHYKFEVTFKNENNESHQFNLVENIGRKLELEKQVLIQKLCDPVIVIAQISVKPISKPAIKAKNEVNNHVIDEKLKFVECGVCLWYMAPPIFQCVTGHSVCEKCMQNLTKCPTCSATYKATRNFTLEKIVSNMIYPCAHTGCTFQTQGQNIRAHEKTCTFEPFICPLKEFENCADSFPVSELPQHIRDKHYENLLEIDTVSMPFDIAIAGQFTEAFITQYRESWFRIVFMYQATSKKFIWSVQHIESPNDNSYSKYNFELEIIDVNSKRSRLYLKSGCKKLMTKADTLLKPDNYIYFFYDLISQFIKHQLTYRIIISSAE